MKRFDSEQKTNSQPWLKHTETKLHDDLEVHLLKLIKYPHDL